MKRDVVQNEKNSIELDKFMFAIENISTKKVSIFYATTYLILLLVVLCVFWNDKKLYGTGFIKGFITATSLFLVYKIMMASLELGILLKNVAFYYNRIK